MFTRYVQRPVMISRSLNNYRVVAVLSEERKVPQEREAKIQTVVPWKPSRTLKSQWDPVLAWVMQTFYEVFLLIKLLGVARIPEVSLTLHGC